MMMNRLVEAARERGIGEITGEVLRENELLRGERQRRMSGAAQPPQPDDGLVRACGPTALPND
jgi:hypothetical protein